VNTGPSGYYRLNGCLDRKRIWLILRGHFARMPKRKITIWLAVLHPDKKFFVD
jgi:hypothetical protein